MHAIYNIQLNGGSISIHRPMRMAPPLTPGFSEPGDGKTGLRKFTGGGLIVQKG